MKNRVLLISLAVMLGLSVGLIGCGQGQLAPSLAIFSTIGGNVSVMKPGANDWIEAEVEMSLEPGDIIKSSDNSSAEITFLDGSTIELQAGTQIEIVSLDISTETDSSIIKLKQTIGSMIFRVTKIVDPASHYEVETPTGVVAIRGSAAQITVIEDGTTRACNLEGDIWAIAQGVELQIPEEQCCTIRPGQSPELIYELSGSWTLYVTPQDGEEEEPYCIDIKQSDSFLYYLDWHKVYSTLVYGNLDGDNIVFSGESKYHDDAVFYSATATIDGDTMRGTYNYTGADNEEGDFWATKAACKMARGWVRVAEIQQEGTSGFWANFWVWDLVDDGISIASATVAGPNIIGNLSLDVTGGTGYFLGDTQPIAGQMYTFDFNYSDGATETTTAYVRETFVDFPTHLSPADGEVVDTLTPTFSWQPPPCGCQGYYRVWILDSQGDDVWSVYLPKETTSVVYNFDGQGNPLESGETYQWRLIAFDGEITGGPDNLVWLGTMFIIQ